MKKRIPGILLAAAVLLTAAAPAALADAAIGGSCGETLEWTLSEQGVLAVSGTGDMADYPDGQSPWREYCGSIRGVELSEGVTGLGAGALRGCGLVETITVPLSLRRIGCGALTDTSSLKSVIYAGSIRTWKGVDIGTDNSFGKAQLVCADKSDPFPDISGWYRDYIVTCYMADVVGGLPDGSFRPQNHVTRAQYIMMLYNMGGRPEVEDAASRFADSERINKVYRPAVSWGVKVGVIAGFDDNTFRPDENISRAQMAAFSCRFLRLGVSENVYGQLEGSAAFTDADAILPCYRAAADIMSGLNVIQGYPDGSFRPDNTATRGEAAAIMSRLLAALTSLRELD